MKKHYTNEKSGINYTLQGDYYLPDLVLPAEKEQSIGIWGNDIYGIFGSISECFARIC